MDEINELIVQQCDLIFRLQAELDEIRELVIEAGINNDGSYRDGVCELIQALGLPETENSTLQKECDRLKEKLEEAVKDRDDARAERDEAENTATADISDALANYLHSIGLPAEPIRSTGNQALDELVRICG